LGWYNFLISYSGKTKMNPKDSLLKRTSALVLFLAAIAGWIFLHTALGFAEDNISIAGQESRGEKNVFVSPDQREISGTIVLAIEEENLGKVEYFLQEGLDGSSLYLGRGKRVDRNRWELQWTTGGVPAGEYFINAQLFNTVGNTIGKSSISVEVVSIDTDNLVPNKNEVESSEVTEVTEDINSGEVITTTNPIIIKNFVQLELSEIEHFDPAIIAAIPLNDSIALHNMIIPDSRIATESEKGTMPAIELSGKGPANAEIILNIFSEPIVVKTTTDNNGDWVYVLHDALEAGRHEIYLTVQDDQGTAVGRSAVMAFFVPEAFSQDQVMRATATAAPVSSAEHLLSQYLWVAVMLVLLVVMVMLTMLRMANRR